MTFEQARDLMDIKIQCTQNNIENKCDKDCKKCNLSQKDEDLMEVYQMAKYVLAKEALGEAFSYRKE